MALLEGLGGLETGLFWADGHHQGRSTLSQLLEEAFRHRRKKYHF